MMTIPLRGTRGKRVKSTINGETTLFVGAHYEVKGSEVTQYYTSTSLSAGFAGATRIAMRTGNNVSYLLSDHPPTTLRTDLGSTSITTDSARRSRLTVTAKTGL